MADKQTLQQFRKRVVAQSILRSGLFGLLIGCGASFLSALVSWFFGYDGGLWLSIGIFVGVTAGSGVILYFTKFRVTDSVLARRIDMLGLDERVVTMMELENDDSYIAQRQREDARAKLDTVSPKQLKFRMAKKIVASIVTASVLAPAMMVVCQLAAGGILRSGMDLINPAANDIAEIEIVYEVEEGGSIDGEEIQIIYKGEDATPVVAVADEGWMFVGWDDGVFDPYRHDKALTESVTFVAIFEEVDEEAESEGEGEGNGEGEGSGDSPAEGKGNGNGNGNGNGDGETNGDGQGEGAGGKHSESNVVINGGTDYGDVFEGYFEGAMDSVADGEGSGSDVGDIVSSYFEGLS